MSRAVVSLEIEGPAVTQQDGEQLARLLEYAVNMAGKSPNQTLKVSEVSYYSDEEGNNNG